jgi:hypothetical protein
MVTTIKLRISRSPPEYPGLSFPTILVTTEKPHRKSFKGEFKCP